MAYIYKNGEKKRVLFAKVNAINNGTEINLQAKTVTPSSFKDIKVLPDTGYVGLSSVTVNTIKLQRKTVTPTTEQQFISYDANNFPPYQGLSAVIVEPIPESYNKQGWPIEVSDPDELDAITENATESDYGKIYKYTGESTAVYTKNQLYILGA